MQTSAFSDEDLKKLKEEMEDLSNVDVVHFIEDIYSLISRLEAAERFCDHIKDNGFPKNLRDKAYDYMNDWLKSKGSDK